jgi:glyoxylase-like metal-dependent hydrolase (beta-lactamase superfamily II)
MLAMFVSALLPCTGCSCGQGTQGAAVRAELLSEGPIRLWRMTVGGNRTNCYALSPQRAKACVLIDPGAQADKILGELEYEGVRPAVILITHGHRDHVGAVEALRNKIPDVTVFCHRKCLVLSELLDGPPRSPVMTVDAQPHSLDAARIDLGEIVFDAYHIPGHAPGSLLFYLRNGGQGMLFSGDTLFRQSVGAGDARTQAKGLRAILPELPPETDVYPGHGAPTVVSWELQHNPFLQVEE